MLIQQNTRNQYIKNYTFTFDFQQSWGPCDVTMTCVSGHLTNAKFPEEYRNWSHPPPEALFTAPVIISVDDVCILTSIHCITELTQA